MQRMLQAVYFWTWPHSWKAQLLNHFSPPKLNFHGEALRYTTYFQRHLQSALGTEPLGPSAFAMWLRKSLHPTGELSPSSKVSPGLLKGLGVLVPLSQAGTCPLRHVLFFALSAAATFVKNWPFPGLLFAEREHLSC